MSAARGDVAVIGAGAAGLMAALFAAGRGRSVTLFESTKDGGRKILISGGGRCNVLPSRGRPERFVTGSSPNILRRILRSWPLPEQRSFFEHELGIPLALEAETGKLFPMSDRARDVRDRLVQAARAVGVDIRFDTRIASVRPSSGGWSLLAGDDRFEAGRLVVATGGLSVPATGSDGAGLRWVEELGHTVVPTYPALTPLTTDPPIHAELAGVSLDVTIEAPGARPRFRTDGGFLFTHRGYSGPSVLDASHLAVRSARDGAARQALVVRWTRLDAEEWERMLLGGGGTVGGTVGPRMPTRLARVLAREAGVAWDRPLSQLRKDERQSLVRHLTAYDLPWSGDEGYRKAEVTGGGVALNEVDPATMESRVVPGLFLCGEILDAFGPIGGHNFSWAWATGRAAGTAAGAP